MKLAAKVGAIEIQGDEVRLVVVNTGGKLPAILEAQAGRAEYDTPADRGSALAATLRDLVGRVKSRPAVYVLCASSEYALVRSATIPFKGKRKIAAAVTFELEPYLAIPLENLVIDHCAIRETGNETEVLAVGMRRELLEQETAILKNAGVEPEGIGLDAAALTTLWQSHHKSPSGLNALFHVREHASILTVSQVNHLVFIRPLSITPDRLLAEPAAVARDIRNTLRAFQTGWKGEESLSGLTVTGMTPPADIRDEFESGITVPVFYADLLEGVKGAGLVDAAIVPPPRATHAEEDSEPPARFHPNRWEACVGAALGAAGVGTAFDFLKGSVAPVQGWRPFMLHTAFSAALAFLVVVGAVGYCIIDYRRNVAELDRIGQEVWQIYSETFPQPQDVQRPSPDLGGSQTMDLMREEHGKIMTKGSQVSIETLMRPPLLDILNDLGERLPTGNVTITELKVRDSMGAEQSVTITGEFTDAAVFDQAFDNLRQSTVLRFEEEPVKSTKNGKNVFTLVATI